MIYIISLIYHALIGSSWSYGLSEISAFLIWFLQIRHKWKCTETILSSSSSIPSFDVGNSFTVNFWNMYALEYRLLFCSVSNVYLLMLVDIKTSRKYFKNIRLKWVWNFSRMYAKWTEGQIHVERKVVWCAPSLNYCLIINIPHYSVSQFNEYLNTWMQNAKG